LVTVSYDYHNPALLTKINFFFSDRFRTAINVFGDSIGCAIVQHLSRKELKALDEKQTSINYIDSNNPNTIVHLPHPQDTIINRLNHAAPAAYDNPTYIHQPWSIPDNEENMGKTYF
jgi:hypothetical protein